MRLTFQSMSLSIKNLSIFHPQNRLRPYFTPSGEIRPKITKSRKAKATTHYGSIYSLIPFCINGVERRFCYRIYPCIRFISAYQIFYKKIANTLQNLSYFLYYSLTNFIYFSKIQDLIIINSNHRLIT